MGLKECLIRFDNPQATYYGGQTVTGRAELTFDSVKKVRSITIHFKGEAHTEWTRNESWRDQEGKQRTKTIYLTGHEEYFKLKYLLITGTSGDSIEIPAGKHVYPFTCALPPTLPSSFEGTNGHVRYTVKVVLDRPWKFDQETKAAFTVLAPLDLNFNPQLKERAQLTVEKFFCCCFCKSGPLTCVVTVPCTGYVPGQAINITCEIDNISNVEVEEVIFKLKKIIDYHSESPHRENKQDEVKIMELKCQGCAEGKSVTFTEKMIIPSLPPSNLINCSIIDLRYELQIQAVAAGFHRDLDSKIPITIGTIPFVGTYPLSENQVNVPMSNAAMPMSPNVSNAAAIGWQMPGASDYSNMPPPSYQECQFGTKSIQDKSDDGHTKFSNGVSSYAPMYPMYPSAPLMPSE